MVQLLLDRGATVEGPQVFGWLLTQASHSGISGLDNLPGINVRPKQK